MPSKQAATEAEVLHASAVAVEGRGLLILGRSGSGKSTLAIQLVALGATLVADDRVIASRRPEGGLILSAPDAIRGRVEARGVGLMHLPAAPARAFAVVDLDLSEDRRLPDDRERPILGVGLPLVVGVEGPALPSILYLYLRSGCLER